MATNLPDAISRYSDRDSDRDVDSIVNLFGDDATVIDEGEERHGTAEIRAWQTGAASKYTYTTEITTLIGNFPGGTADLKWDFTIAGQHITRLRSPNSRTSGTAPLWPRRDAPRPACSEVIRVREHLPPLRGAKQLVARPGVSDHLLVRVESIPVHADED